MPKNRPASVVLLTAKSSRGSVVEEQQINYDMYFGDGVKLIDSAEYRAARGIARVHGEIYDSAGSLQQTFDNVYDNMGKYSGGKTVHDDGTVIED
ncbi:hypothetical protein [Aeoliella mucimassa]|uniref:Uncharacterized protein n=1 Tax=Aeoliella mucimassa TaxID=2527972 RepID=A0A518AQR0_9BACT|nr:hypothetical protein [Aeoliella mucimassa]QDU57061.1 hypothetical protein Pan181_32750 [Aeoliella mucimassa]